VAGVKRPDRTARDEATTTIAGNVDPTLGGMSTMTAITDLEKSRVFYGVHEESSWTGRKTDKILLDTCNAQS
jgi:hypothetical protein